MELKYVIGSYAVLVLSLAGVGALILWVDGTTASGSIKNITELLCGAVFGGECYLFYEKGFLTT